MTLQGLGGLKEMELESHNPMNQPDTSAASKEISCEQCRELLSDYVDREISEAQQSLVELHLKSCLKCGTESSRLMGLKQIVQHWDGVQGSSQFHKSVMEKMIRESQQTPADQFNAAALARENELANSTGRVEDARTLSAVWILLAAAFIAVAAYFVVLKLRGGL